ncbi:MAG: transporter substrate-binding domain-containing protein, partial [Arcobacteraceae bacterium]
MNLVLKIFIVCFVFMQVVYSEQLNFSQEEKEYLSKNTPLIVHGHNAFPPFNYIENGKPMGYTYDYMKLMSKYTGIKFQFTQAISWNEAMEKFQNNEIDILPHLAKTDERLEYVD